MDRERFWWVHHESESIDFVHDEEEIYRMQEHEIVEPISVEMAQELINKGYVFNIKRLLE